jgi:hypothetical protein
MAENYTRRRADNRVGFFSRVRMVEEKVEICGIGGASGVTLTRESDSVCPRIGRCLTLFSYPTTQVGGYCPLALARDRAKWAWIM